MTNCTFSGNRASGDYGGGIENYSTAMVTNSTLTGNSALTAAASPIQRHADGDEQHRLREHCCTSGYGGGIDNSGGTATVTNSTLTGNISHTAAASTIPAAR